MRIYVVRFGVLLMMSAIVVASSAGANAEGRSDESGNRTWIVRWVLLLVADAKAVVE